MLLQAAGGKGTDNSYTETKTVETSKHYTGTAGAPRTGYGLAFTITASRACTVSVSCSISSSAASKESFKLKVNGSEITGFVRSASFSVKFTSAGSISVYALGGVNSVSFSYSFYAPTSEVQTITHVLNGGAGGGSTQVSSLMTNTSISGSNTGNGYVIITCLSIHSLIINCKHCTIEGCQSLELIEAKTYSIKALHSMVIDGIPSILDNISIPEGLVMYANIIDLRLVELIVDDSLLTRGEEYTVEAFYHKNIRLNSDFYKNAENSLSDFLKIVGG